MNRDALRAALRGRVAFDEPMSRHTSLRVGGPADALAWPCDVDDVRALCAWCAHEHVPLVAIGAGSNLLVRDGGVRGVVLATGDLRELARTSDTTVRCGAGVRDGRLLVECAAWGLSGIEFLAGIPGTVGGGVAMNAGTRRGEFAGVVARVTTVGPDGRVHERDREACGFSYRATALPAGEVVVAADLSLTPRPRDAIKADVAAIQAERASREPREGDKAGSIFKNPPGDHAGRLIEACGLKGRREGGAEISPAHANWIVSAGGATARDVLALVDRARAEVASRFAVTLEVEVRVVGEE